MSTAKWIKPSERLPTFEDGPRRFSKKVEVEVRCAAGVQRRNCFVGGGFDDDDFFGMKVIAWRPVASSGQSGPDVLAPQPRSASV
ncbi:hypothetical protein [Duganella vulcania]|uniref:DUF551 domain-containing protein n=1 Tax=Duganella vulcania TaxID=2692166 RepID=A0A845GF08_9BURK|nr:hypothetical protein [Duganella vulcania]MYM92501.1 hypothetical protein [Duganella vulcania]